MKTRVKLVVGLILFAAVLCATAQQVAESQAPVIISGDMDPYNVVLSDGGTRFLRSCTEVRIYSIDPDKGVRTGLAPVVVRVRPADMMQLLLQPGRYELAIWMFYLSTEVHFLYFNVPDSGVIFVELMAVEFPEELMTY